MRNVLYISYDGMTDPLGQSQVLPYISGLTKKGIQFHLISFEKKERFDAQRKDIEQLCAGAGITWHPMMYTKKPPLLSTVYDVFRMRKKALSLHKKTPFDHIHCRSYISALVGLHFKRKQNVPFLFDMRGFWADERVDGGIWNISNPVFKMVFSFFKRKEIEFLQESAATISLTHAGKKEILSWNTLHTAPDIEVIPCCVDLSIFTAVSDFEKSNVRQKLHIDLNKRIVGYVGSLGTWYLLDEMLGYFKWLIHTHPDFHFLIITQDERTIVDNLAAEISISKDNYTVVKATRIEIPALLSLMHHALFFIRPSFSKLASSPTKQGEIMAMGIPLICNTKVGDTAEIVQQFKCGGIVDSFNTVDFERAFEEVQGVQPESGIQGALSFYDLNEGIEKYFTVYQRIWSLPTSV